MTFLQPLFLKTSADGGLLNSLAEPFFHETGSILGLAPLLKQAFSGTDLTPVVNCWIEHVRHRRDANTILDLSIALELLRKRELALAIQADALKIAQHFHVASTAVDVALRLLVLKAPGDLSTNTPIECLLEDTDIAVELLYVGPGLPLPEVLPEHDVLFVAVAESNENRLILEDLQQRLASWPRPYLNAPGEILKLERSSACNFLSSVPGIVMPQTKHVDRGTLQQVARGELPIPVVLASGEFPVIVRPIDSHAGRGLIKAESPNDILSYLDDRADSHLFTISRFIDYSSVDGLFRKYRIVMMHGQPFICHMGISDHWMVHYPYQEMIPSAARRAEEERVMTTFNEDFVRRHQSALNAIHQEIQLDYFGLDCAESVSGELVIFEVASAMLVHAMDSSAIFPYKEVQMRKVLDAFRKMLSTYHRYSRAAHSAG
jgi:hypothetical protein